MKKDKAHCRGLGNGEYPDPRSPLRLVPKQSRALEGETNGRSNPPPHRTTIIRTSPNAFPPPISTAVKSPVLPVCT